MTIHQRFTDSFLILKLFESLTRSEICFFLSVVSFSPSSAMISWLQMMQSNLNLIDNYFTSGKILGICPEVASVLPCRHERFRILFKSCDATKKTKEWAQRTSEWNKWIKIFEALSTVRYILRFFLTDLYIPKIGSERLKVLHYDLKSFDQSETRTMVPLRVNLSLNEI